MTHHKSYSANDCLSLLDDVIGLGPWDKWGVALATLWGHYTEWDPHFYPWQQQLNPPGKS